MHVPSVARVLRVIGLAGTLAGCGLAVAALSAPWTVDGPEAGTATERSGWASMAYGDLLLVATCALVAILAIALCVGPNSRKVSRTAGVAALSLLLVALAGVATLYWMSGLDFSFFDDDPRQLTDQGPGYLRAGIGLGVAVVGVLVLLAGRWETRTRRAIKRDLPPPEPTWLKPVS